MLHYLSEMSVAGRPGRDVLQCTKNADSRAWRRPRQPPISQNIARSMSHVGLIRRARRENQFSLDPPAGSGAAAVSVHSQQTAEWGLLLISRQNTLLHSVGARALGGKRLDNFPRL